ncbi:MAG: helix-turn-helix transcriptional regulator [Clostridia bacterium]|nr:helix-turn-helix transcriptional regulator [Clostridia bacterium]
MSFMKSIREEKGLSQEGFARISGYHRNTIQRQEAKLLPAPEFVAELIILTNSDADSVAQKYSMYAERAVLTSVRQRISPLH